MCGQFLLQVHRSSELQNDGMILPQKALDTAELMSNEPPKGSDSTTKLTSVFGESSSTGSRKKDPAE